MYDGIPDPPVDNEGFVADGPEGTSDSSPNMVDVIIGTLVGAVVVVSLALLLVGSWRSRVMQRLRKQRSGQQTEIDIEDLTHLGPDSECGPDACKGPHASSLRRCQPLLSVHGTRV